MRYATLALLILAITGCSTAPSREGSSAGSAPATADLMGEWVGEGRNRGSGSLNVSLTIKERHGDRASGAIYFANCTGEACNRAWPADIEVSGPPGGEALRVGFMGTGQMQLQRTGESMEGTIFLTQNTTVTLKRSR